jgi:diguanylate cyclase (GGDEF)-like protein/PAS domain S-box-containing protein
MNEIRQNQGHAGAYADAGIAFATHLLEHSSEMLAAVDTDLRVVGVNIAFRREFNLIFGKPIALGDRLDDTITDLVGERGKATALCRRAFDGESFCVIEEFGDKHLLRKTYELAFRPIPDSHGHAVLAGIAVRDLTGERSSEHSFVTLLEASPDALLIVRADGIIYRANTHALRMFHYDHPLNGLSIEVLLPERFRHAHVAHRLRFFERSAARAMGGGSTDLWGLRADGSEFPVEISLNPLEENGTRMVVAAIRDMTSRQAVEDRLRQLSIELEDRVAERTGALEQANRQLSARIKVQQETEVALRSSEARFSRAFENIPDVVVIYDRDLRIEYVNPAITLLTGHPTSHFIGRLDEEVWPREVLSLWRPRLHTAVETTLIQTVDTQFPGMAGSRHLVTACVPLSDAAAAVHHVMSISHDYTERKQAEERVLHAGLHDVLTGLPNRMFLFEYADHLFSRARYPDRHIGVLSINLDRFRVINDMHGHAVGDAVLQEVALRLKKDTRQEDLAFRIGGDEFLVLLPEVKNAEDAAEVARHLTNALCLPYHVPPLELTVSPSIGISIYPQDGEDTDTLLHHADVAMYEAKQLGSNRFQFFSQELAEKANAHLKIEQQLKFALVHEEFRLYYQPIIDVQTKAVVSVEALLRWSHREIGPDRFIPVAEATGLIDQLGDWVIYAACHQHSAWLDHGLPAIPIAVNVSAVQFRGEDFAGHFVKIMQDCKVQPGALQLEITETAVMENLDHAIKILSLLKASGVKILLDDFGTGYSSLNYLSRLPLDKIKIDQSFIRQLETDMTSRAITGAIIALGHTLKLDVVAEGIESDTDLHYLHVHGCNHAQGFHVSAPISADAFESWYWKHLKRYH